MAAGSVVSRSKVLLVIDLNRVFNLTCFVGAGKSHEVGSWARRPRHCRHVSTSCSKALSSTTHVTTSPPEAAPAPGSVVSTRISSDGSDSEVKVEYRGGLPQVTVPLPSRRELCRFTLRPVSNTVGDFLNMLQHEDHGIDRVTVSTKDGVRIASSNTIESLMDEDFKLLVNDREYLVRPPAREKLSKEDVKRLSDVKSLVNQLYEALNVDEHQVKKERELLGKLEELRIALEPMEKKRDQLETVAIRRTNALTWVGLGLMSVQFGILARLTWWEYSWDIMEPVTYFVTYGTAMAAYAYFVLTKQEYLLPEVRDRQHLIILHKKARKVGLDIDQYNALKEEVARIEMDLARLRDPIKVHLPPSHLSHIEMKTVSPLDRLKSIINKARFK